MAENLKDEAFLDIAFKKLPSRDGNGAGWGELKGHPHSRHRPRNFGGGDGA